MRRKKWVRKKRVGSVTGKVSEIGRSARRCFDLRMRKVQIQESKLEKSYLSEE